MEWKIISMSKKQTNKKAVEQSVAIVLRAGNSQLNLQKHSALSTMCVSFITYTARTYGSYNSKGTLLTRAEKVWVVHRAW